MTFYIDVSDRVHIPCCGVSGIVVAKYSHTYAVKTDCNKLLVVPLEWLELIK
jgi:hypothetical protein